MALPQDPLYNYRDSAIGQTRATFGLSNTPDLHQGENFATRESLEARPSTLHVVRYTCS